MILLPQSAELLVQKSSSLHDIYDHIENAARTCYQSFENKTDGSSERMVKMLLKNKHTAMLEHATVYMTIPFGKVSYGVQQALRKLDDGFSSRKVIKLNGYTYFSVSYRKLMELDESERAVLDEFWTDYEEGCHAKRVTVKCVTNLQVATELLRHRRFSFAMESTRYCNYSKGKFGNSLSFITPCFLSGDKLDMDVWTKSMESIEDDYMRLLQSGWSQQEAAQVLPKALKTEIVMTGWEDTWADFFRLRYDEETGKVHPQMKELATMIHELLADKQVVHKTS